MNVMVTNMPWLKHTITQSTLGKYKCQEIVHGYVVVDVYEIKWVGSLNRVANWKVGMYTDSKGEALI